MVERAAIQEMLDELRFDEVERLIDQTDGDPDPRLMEEVTRRRAEAEEQARELSRRIVELGEERRLDAVADLARDSSTRSLLHLVPETARKRPELYLREAERWEDKRREINARRLAEARRALDGLDLELAGGLMNRIDGRFLTEGLEAERDQLLLDISARSMEMESLADTGDQLIDKDRPQKKSRERPWWRRWL